LCDQLQLIASAMTYCVSWDAKLCWLLLMTGS